MKKKWGLRKHVKNRPPLFKTLLENIDDILMVIAIMAVGIYIIIFTYVLYSKCTNLGWKRLAIVVSFVPASVIAFFLLDEADFKVNGGEYFQIILGAIAGYISGIFTILGGQRLVVWIKDGFNPSK